MDKPVLRAVAVLALLSPVATHSQATPWKIEMRQVRLPTANGDCGPIELVARDAEGRPPLTPDGKQVDWQDFDITLTQGAGPLKLSSNGRFLCATAPGATGVITVKYPDSSYAASSTGRGRTGKQLIAGVTASASFDVRSAGKALPAIAAVTSTSGGSTAGATLAPAPVPVGTKSPATTEPSATRVPANIAPINTGTPTYMTNSPTAVANSSGPTTGASSAESPPLPVSSSATSSTGSTSGTAAATLVTTANVRSGTGPWQSVGPADWSCLNTPSSQSPSTQSITISGSTRAWPGGPVVPGVAVAAFAGSNAARVLAGSGSTSSSNGAYTLGVPTLPTGTTTMGFRSSANGHIDTYDIGNYFNPAISTHVRDLQLVAIAAADSLAALAKTSRQPGSSLVLGALEDCQGRRVAGATATVSSTPYSSAPVPGISAAYLDPSGGVSTGGTSLASGEFLVLNVPLQSTAAYLQLWGFPSDAAAAQRQSELLAVTVLPAVTGSAIVAAVAPRRDGDGVLDAVAGTTAATSTTAPTATSVATGSNPGFSRPTSTTRANAYTGGKWVEVGSADWTCLRTPSADAPSTQQIGLTGTVASWAYNGLAAATVGGANVVALAGKIGGRVAGVATVTEASLQSSSYSMTLATLPPGVTRVVLNSRAEDHLETFLPGIYLSPNTARQSLDVPIVAARTADALARDAGLVRDPARSLLIGAVRDCQNRPVSHAAVTVSAQPESAAHVAGAATAYFAPAGQLAAPQSVPVTAGDGRFAVLNLPVTSSDGYVQAWGFSSAEDLAAGRLTLLGVLPTPIPAGSAMILDLEPRRE